MKKWESCMLILVMAETLRVAGLIRTVFWQPLETRQVEHNHYDRPPSQIEDQDFRICFR